MEMEMPDQTPDQMEIDRLQILFPILLNPRCCAPPPLPRQCDPGEGDYPKRLATRRGGTRPTCVQYFSARGGKCARLSCTHAAVSLPIVCGRGRARGAMAQFAVSCANWATETQPDEFRLAPADERVWNCHGHVYSNARKTDSESGNGGRDQHAYPANFQFFEF
jgi:hypothetical protein